MMQVAWNGDSGAQPVADKRIPERRTDVRFALNVLLWNFLLRNDSVISSPPV